jgi:hypothetical protein
LVDPTVVASNDTPPGRASFPRDIRAAAPIVNVILLSFMLAMAVTPLLEWSMGKGRKPGVAVALTILIVVGSWSSPWTRRRTTC